MNEPKNAIRPVVLVLLMICSLSIVYSQIDGVTGATAPKLIPGNSLFHKTDEISLSVSAIYIGGEIENPGKIDLLSYYKREIIIKETFINDKNEAEFSGAFRYRGYSLFDLLNPRLLNKKNTEKFRPQTDLYIIIENMTGERVVFSWSEIYHTNNPHQIIIATEAAPIKSYRKDAEYKIGNKWKVVSATDHFSNRVLENPVKITVKSFDKKDYIIQRNLDPLYSPDIQVDIENDTLFTIPPIRDNYPAIGYSTSFFGMGMGYHDNKVFEGISLKSVFADAGQSFDKSWIQKGLVTVASIDGYRAVFSFSELFNRFDQVQAILSIGDAEEKSGYYRLFLPSDFYADRSVKAIKELYFFKI